MTPEQIAALRREIEEETRSRIWRDSNGNLVGVVRGIGTGETAEDYRPVWIAARGRHRVKSKDLPAQDSRERMQVLLNAFARRKGWKEHTV